MALSQADSTRAELTCVELRSYDRVVVAFSGGKDGTACVLHLKELGVDPRRIELWHHDVDGREGTPLRFDWPITPDYCRKFAAAFDMPIYFSWKEGGFAGELLRENGRTRPIQFETPAGPARAGGTRGKLATRRRFPQQSADLRVRWCSGYLKVDVGAMAITHQARFDEGRTLFVSGERAEESAARARYAPFEPHRTDSRNGRRRRRHIDHWRPVHGWTESEVWDILRRHRVNPHPAYHLGWGRVSCMTCIFGSAAQWASIRAIDPARFDRMADYERQFGCTIHRNRKSVRELAGLAAPYRMDPEMVRLALSEVYTAPVILPEETEWRLPQGAFGDLAGPC